MNDIFRCPYNDCGSELKIVSIKKAKHHGEKTGKFKDYMSVIGFCGSCKILVRFEIEPEGSINTDGDGRNGNIHE